MDTSKEYILQCEKAVKLQELWNEISPNFNEKDFGFKNKEGGFTTVFRQDQLQEMVGGTSYYKTSVIYSFINRIPANAEQYKYSMEQLWLTFVMHELYKKKWSTEKQNWTTIGGGE